MSDCSNAEENRISGREAAPSREAVTRTSARLLAAPRSSGRLGFPCAGSDCPCGRCGRFCFWPSGRADLAAGPNPRVGTWEWWARLLPAVLDSPWQESVICSGADDHVWLLAWRGGRDQSP